MFYSNDIFKIFYNCSDLPLILIDSSYNILDKEGTPSGFQKIFSQFKESNFLENNPLNDIPFNWCSEDGINFYIVPQRNMDTFKYFLIGPYKTEVHENHLMSSIQLVDPKCLKYLYELLINIIKDHSLNNPKLSPNIIRVIKHVEDNYSEPICVSELCKNFNINKCYFCKLFKKETGLTFIQYLNNFKVEKSKELLKDSNLSLLEIAFEVGFTNQSYFSTIFKKVTGISPLDYRNSFK